MLSNRQENGREFGGGGGGALRWIYVAAGATGFVATLAFTHTYGRRYWAWSAFFGLATLVLGSMLADDPRLLLFVVYAYLPLLVIQRVHGLVQHARGMRVHSWYAGFPYMAGRCGLVGIKARSFTLCVLAPLWGGLMMLVFQSPGLLAYHLVGAVAGTMKLVYDHLLLDAEAQDAIDAHRESQALRDRVRRLR